MKSLWWRIHGWRKVFACDVLMPKNKNIPVRDVYPPAMKEVIKRAIRKHGRESVMVKGIIWVELDGSRSLSFVVWAKS